MALFRLWIKGEPDCACMAAIARDVESITLRDVNSELNWTVIDADVHELTVQNWFIEPPRQAPYPTGTLLFYQPVAPVIQ